MSTPEGGAGSARVALLASIAQSQLLSYESSGQAAILDEAVSTSHFAVAAATGEIPELPVEPVGLQERQQALLSLGDSLLARYERTSGEDDLRAAMTAFRDAGAADGSRWIDGPARRTSAWIDAYRTHRDLGALDRAVRAWDHLLGNQWFATLPADMRAAAQAGSGEAYLRRYEERGDRADLAEAVRCCTASVEDTGHENYRAHVNNLSRALLASYESDGNRESLVHAVELARQLVESAPDGSTERAKSLTNLGGILQRVWQASGDPADLDTEVDAFNAAARIPVADPAIRASCLNNASVGLHNRYDMRGSEADLEQSITFSRQAVTVAPDGWPDLPGTLTNLGNTLRHRYERTGMIAELDDAIAVLQQAESTAPEGWRGRRICLTNLASALRARAQVSRSSELAAQAVRAASAAVLITPEQSPDFDLYAANLAVEMGVLAASDPAKLDEQIGLYEEVLGRLPADSARHPRLLANLASALLDRNAATAASPDIERALELAREAAASSEPGTAEQARRIATLARALATRAAQIRSAQAEPVPAGTAEGLAAEASDAYRDASAAALRLAPADCLATATQWARWAEDSDAWETAREAYRLAADAVDRLFATQIGRQDKELWLQAANGVPSQAALALVRAGEPEAAALMLERGRTRLLAESLGRTSAVPAALAAAGHEALAERLGAALRRLGALAASSADDRGSLVHPDRMRGDDLSAALAEHDAALATIRQIPGYEGFLMPPDPGDLAAAANPPLVYLAAARQGGLALIVTPAPGQPNVPSVEAIDLPALTEEAVRRRAALLQDARKRRGHDPGVWQGVLDSVCRWLWTAAMQPVLARLRGASCACLLPAGLLVSLPLHAAWKVDGTRPTGRRYALDEIVLGYAPSAASLLHARGVAGQRRVPALLTVANPQPTGAAPLPLASTEASIAAAALRIPVTTLQGSGATCERVLAALPGRSVVHFACHGRARLEAPMESALLLAGNTLLLLGDLLRLDLAGQHRPGIGLAVLSACETQIPGSQLPDEVVSLPSGFLQAGAAGIVASQWMLDDTAAALLAAVFYPLLAAGRGASASLAQAQAWLRDTTNGVKAVYLHPVTGRSGLPAAAVRPLWRWAVTQPAGDRPFALPAQWAAMTYTGAAEQLERPFSVSS